MKMVPVVVIGFFSLIGAVEGFSRDDWKAAEVSDTMVIFLKETPAGKLYAALVVKDKKIETNTKLVTEMSDGSNTSSMTVMESRNYSFDGDLISAYQEISGPAGKNSWSLKKKSGGEWEINVNAGGVSNSRKIGNVHERITSTCEIYKGIHNSSIKVGDIWTDTAFELTSAKHVYNTTRCIETPIAKNGNKWVFQGRNSVNDRDELWKIDKTGKTIEREVYPFIARKSTGKNSGRRPVNLFNAFSIKANGPASDWERVCVTLDSSFEIDSSASNFYTRSTGCNILRRMKNKCTSRFLADSVADSLIPYTLPTPTMQINSPFIAELADSLRGKYQKSCEMVKGFNDYVYRRLQKRNTATFSSALETLNAGFGDCGEHSVLLAALLRSAGIPARVVLGLVYVKSMGGYDYHAWVMAYTGEWVFADPSHGVFPANYDRVPLVIDDKGEKAIELSRLIGRVKIEYRQVSDR